METTHTIFVDCSSFTVEAEVLFEYEGESYDNPGYSSTNIESLVLHFEDNSIDATDLLSNSHLYDAFYKILSKGIERVWEIIE